MFIKVMTTEQMISDLVCDEYANWSIDGARALVEYLEEWSDMAEQPIEWDRVAIRCDFTEFTSWDSICGSYEMDEEDIKDATTVIECANGHVILQEF